MSQLSVCPKIITLLMGWAILTLSTNAAPTLAPPATVQFIKALEPGDLLIVKDESQKELTLRLYGVACPLGDPDTSAKAIDFIGKALSKTIVTVEFVTEDNNGLPVAWVQPEEGPSLNEQLVSSGLAWWDAINTPEEDHLKKVLATALQQGTGLWKAPAPLAPWDYRTSHHLPELRYRVEESPKTAKSPAEEETPTLAAKGTAKPRPSAPAMALVPEEYLGLVTKHQPRIVRDGQGNAMGLTANEIGAIPGASQIGFQNGDIVRSVNGIALTSEGQLLGLIGQLQGAKQLQLEVVRGGKIVAINIPL